MRESAGGERADQGGDPRRGDRREGGLPAVRALAGDRARPRWLVGNDSDGVFAEVEGPPAAVEVFLHSLARDAPPLARIEWTNATAMLPHGTASRDFPPDRPVTTMADYAMCNRVRSGVPRPADRRCRAQPTCCPACGPVLSPLDRAGTDLHGPPLAAAADLLRRWKVLAVKELGGYATLTVCGIPAVRGEITEGDVAGYHHTATVLPCAWVISSQVITPDGRAASSEPAGHCGAPSSSAQACNDCVNGDTSNDLIRAG